MGRHRRTEILFRKFKLEFPASSPRYNIAPTEYVPVVYQEDDAKPATGEFYWGLIPFWSRDMDIGAHTINARAETIDEKPAFRHAFKSRRCLIPASGFYEWKAGPDKKTKTPYYFTSKDDDEPLVFAGLWERWDKAGHEILSFTIITTEANCLMEPIHNRMPAILHPDDWSEWLDPGIEDHAHLLTFLRPAPDDMLQYWEVSSYVNSPKHEGEECIRKAS